MLLYSSFCCLHLGTDHVPVGPTTRPDVRPPPPGANLLFAQNGKIDHIPLNGNNMNKEETKTMLHLPVSFPQLNEFVGVF